MQKILFILLGSLIFLTSCAEEYRDHFFRETHPLVIVSSSGSVSETAELRVLPDRKVLDTLVDDLRSAQKRIWITLYTWTEKDTLAAAIEAKQRGVDVRVILEGNVYQTPFINKNTFDTLSGAQIPVVYADNTRYTFTHAKYWLIDDTFCIATGNWTYTSFTKNRDMILCDRSPLPLSNLASLFVSDFEHKKPIFPDGLDERLGISSIQMRPWLTNFIAQSKHTLYIYDQSITDPSLLDLLSQKQESGIDLRLCSADNDDEPAAGSGFLWSKIKKPYPHIKVLLRDDADMILGSVNLTQNALDNNREVAILINKNTKIYSQVKKIFFQDCLGSKVAKK